MNLLLFFAFFSHLLFSQNIIFLDGIPASGKSSLGQALAKVIPGSVLISSDDIAEKEKINYGESVKRALFEAEKYHDKTVIIDAFYMPTEWFLKKRDKLFIVLVYLPLEDVITRFAKRAGLNTLPSDREKKLRDDFNEKYTPSIKTPYDLLVNSRNQTPEELAGIVRNKLLTK